MSIYATLWRLKFPGAGDDHTGCAWVGVIAQGVPAHIGSPTPDIPDEEADPFASFLPPAIAVSPEDEDHQMRAVVFVTEGTRKGTERSAQEYVDPLLVLSGREYAAMSLEALHDKICDALRGDRPRLVAESWGPDGRVRLLFADGSVQDTESRDRNGRGGQPVSKFQGFSTLATPADLLEKLRHDLSRIRRNSTHPYAAFDFFVTAEHLLDWKYPDTGGQSNKDTRSLLRTTTPLLRVVSHLANGAKHFKATRHKSVDSVGPHSGFFDQEFFDPGFFDTDSLRVQLIGDDALALGPEITVLALAQQVLEYWEADLASPSSQEH